ncbi:HAD-IB family phosphatase [Cuneatibacter caecimuris]|uniref:phosphoserine phosphatase n=1 Tax=Cuneatibacter caecimuris TaxID=1796618 RepID=A0A4Q7PK90_9FIRM|nr:HAD-IB family phosphatase [Cuneatibacter caecimuris]RZT01133.1 HAD superfamily phosphoserine phosphatase-like hydrolase [Cuneatibacter caecimuris]
MGRYKFLFDLDATITKLEILPEIARRIDCVEQMQELTERTMSGEIPFDRSFTERVNILKKIPVSTVQQIILQVPLHQELVRFIQEHREDCYVVTGNLDVWICRLMEKLGLEGHYFCSIAEVDESGENLLGIRKVIDKSVAIRQIPTPFVAVGDGNNDAEMIGAAEIGIGFGGVRPIAPAVLQNATHAVYTEEKLCQFLRQL